MNKSNSMVIHPSNGRGVFHARASFPMSETLGPFGPPSSTLAPPSSQVSCCGVLDGEAEKKHTNVAVSVHQEESLKEMCQ